MTYVDTLKAISFGSIMAVAVASVSFAEVTTDGSSDIMTISTSTDVSKDDARKIVNQYLKANKKRSQRIGKIEQDQTSWAVHVLTRENFPVSILLVDKETAEITVKK